MVSTQKRDILLLGATGYTGQLILRYLAARAVEYQGSPAAFSISLGGRSVERLQKVVAAIPQLQSEDIPIHNIDVSDESSLKDLISNFHVVITAVGPFWRYGRTIIGVCAQLGVHYVDTTGETWFIKDAIDKWDYYATNTGAILIPSSGFDSVPSDMSAFLGVQNLRKQIGRNVQAGNSTSAFAFKAFAFSGGTAETIMDALSGQVPRYVMGRVRRDPYALSPAVGPKPAGPKLTYQLPFTNIIGSFFFMSAANTQYVRRSWGLYQTQSTEPYGPNFNYSEFWQKPNRLVGLFTTLVMGLGFAVMMTSPGRWLMKKFLLHAPGGGPAEQNLEKGWFKVTNVTEADGEPSRAVKTVIKGNGEPGYLLTGVIVSETALALLPSNRDRLTSIGKQGGVLTTMSALGNELIQRLESTGRFTFESSPISPEESRKNR